MSVSKHLNKVLDEVGFGENDRRLNVKAWSHLCSLKNIYAFVQDPDWCYCETIIGSLAEGTSLKRSSAKSNYFMYIPFVEVSDVQSEQHSDLPYLRMVKDATTRPGYTKLQIGKSQNFKNPATSVILNQACVLYKKFDESFLSNILVTHSRNVSVPSQTEQIKGITPFNSFSPSYMCTKLPEDFVPYFERKRSNDWPSTAAIELFKQLGCFYVPCGHPKSKERDLEWKVFCFYHELYLMQNLSQTQYKCYILLKILKEHFINPACGNILSSYQCKTVLFYTIENNDQTIWKPQYLTLCFEKCIQQLYDCVYRRCCPDYFIPNDNLFEFADQIEINLLEDWLQNFLQGVEYGIGCFIETWKDKQRKHAKDSTLLTNVYDMHQYIVSIKNDVLVHKMDRSTITEDVAICAVLRFLEDVLRRIHKIVLPQMRNEDVASFRHFPERAIFWLMNEMHGLGFILSSGEVQSYKREAVTAMLSHAPDIAETFQQATLSLHTKMASLLLVKAIQDRRSDTWNEALAYSERVHSASYQFECSLKRASTLQKNGKFEECKRTLSSNEMSRSNSLLLPLYCFCENNGHANLANISSPFLGEYTRVARILKSAGTHSLHGLVEHVPPCLTFDTLETNMVPTFLVYEAHRSFVAVPVNNRYPDWYRWVVVDPFIYRYVLMYKTCDLLTDEIGMMCTLTELEDVISNGLYTGAVVHPETALNSLGHIYITKGWYREPYE